MIGDDAVNAYDRFLFPEAEQRAW